MGLSHYSFFLSGEKKRKKEKKRKSKTGVRCQSGVTSPEIRPAPWDQTPTLVSCSQRQRHSDCPLSLWSSASSLPQQCSLDAAIKPGWLRSPPNPCDLRPRDPILAPRHSFNSILEKQLTFFIRKAQSQCGQCGTRL